MSTFNLVVAGGRDFTDRDLLDSEIHKLRTGKLAGQDIVIISGMARGADIMAWQFAQREGLKCWEFVADWDTHKKAAGIIRNKEMSEVADGLLAFWDGQSRGTKHMIDTMKKLNKPVRTVRYTAKL